MYNIRIPKLMQNIIALFIFYLSLIILNHYLFNIIEILNLTWRSLIIHKYVERMQSVRYMWLYRQNLQNMFLPTNDIKLHKNIFPHRQNILSKHVTRVDEFHSTEKLHPK